MAGNHLLSIAYSGNYLWKSIFLFAVAKLGQNSAPFSLF
jgi:hypothetical protein